MSELLNIEHLSVSFAAEEGKMEAVRDCQFFPEKRRSSGNCRRIRLWEKCTVQKYHETAFEKWMD